ncbi:MAG: AAA family ATPase [Candidatus Binatia bacterium]
MPRTRRQLAAAAIPDSRSALVLHLRLLGEMELNRDGRRLALPPSKKTRALLAYLVVTQRPQRRDRLCGLLWDVADDPRAALRWSLSKLRPLVDEPRAPRLVAQGATVAFEPVGACIDLFTLRDRLAADRGAALPTAELVALAAEFRGPFLEGLELPDFLEFQSWVIAVREEARGLHAGLLATLVDRLAEDPAAALPFARTLAQVDPFNEEAHGALVRLLAAAGRRGEAEQQAQAAARLLREVDGGGAVLQRLRRGLSPAAVPAAAPESAPLPAPATALVGRAREWEALRAALAACRAESRLCAVLLVGEPGIGKTRLLAELMAETARRGGTVLEGSAFEAESDRPYGPWIDALRRLPPVAIGDQLGGELAPLLPELGQAAARPESRDRLFGAVAELLAARAHSAPPVLLLFDDVHWCDAASAELLHYLARMNRHRPVLLALSARDGELADNAAILRVLRGLRHDGLLEEIAVAPLSADETAALVRGVAPDGASDRVFAESAGNPLFALEVARSLPHRPDGVPLSLRRLVRDRVARLPADAADVLRWGAVIGRGFDSDRLAALCAIDAARLLAALEALERHALLRAVPAAPPAPASYGFAHDVVRQVVYADLSEPRRRLMHQRIVGVLQAGGEPDETAAADLAHHAALAGDGETAARACLRAAQRCLRLFAGAEADALRGAAPTTPRRCAIRSARRSSSTWPRCAIAPSACATAPRPRTRWRRSPRRRSPSAASSTPGSGSTSSACCVGRAASGRMRSGRACAPSRSAAPPTPASGSSRWARRRAAWPCSNATWATPRRWRWRPRRWPPESGATRRRPPMPSACCACTRASSTRRRGASRMRARCAAASRIGSASSAPSSTSRRSNWRGSAATRCAGSPRS